jgi:hypothetical protein
MNAYSVEMTVQFEVWLNRLDNAENESVDASIGLLEARGPMLWLPHARAMKSSRHPSLRQLYIRHVQSVGSNREIVREFGVFYANVHDVFVLLNAGERTNNFIFDETMIKEAEEILNWIYDTRQSAAN